MRTIKSIANLKDLAENKGSKETEKEKSIGSIFINNQMISKNFKLKIKNKKLAKNVSGKNEVLENERNKDPDYILPQSSKASCSMVEENVASGSKSLVNKDNVLTAKEEAPKVPVN